MAALGRLVVSLGLDLAEFTSGLTKAEYESKLAAERIAKNLDNAAALGITALGVLAAAGGAALAKLNVEAEKIAGFQDLADVIGDTAEQVATLQLAADLSGTSLDAVAAASVKLTSALAKTDDESKAVGQGIKALGLNFEAFKQLSPVERIDAISKSLAGFEDGAEKTAIAVAILGKSGAELLPFLNDLSEEGERQVRLTADQIAAADEYSKAQARARSELDQFAQKLSANALPTLGEVQKVLVQIAKDEAVVETATALLKFALDAALTVFQTLVVVGANVGFVLLGVGREIGALAAQAVALARLDINGFHAISDAVKADGVAAKKALDKFESQVLSIGQTVVAAPTDDNYSNEGRSRPRPRRPRPNISGLNQDNKSGAAAAALKKSLDEQLSAIRDFAEQQRSALDYAQRYLDGAYTDGTISLQETISEQRRLREVGLAATVKSYDREIEALEAYRRRLVKPEDRADADGRIADAAAKRGAAIAKAGQDAVLSAQAEAREVAQLAERYADLQRQVLEFEGDSAGAGSSRIAKQVEEARRLINAQGGDQGQADRLQAALQGQLALSEAQKQYNGLLEQARDAEEATLLAAEKHGATELDTLRAVGAVRGQALSQLGEMAQKARELAEQLKTPEAKAFADQLTLGFERAAASANTLLTKMRDVSGEIASVLAAGFEDAILSGKGLREIINGIGEDILRISTRTLVTDQLEKQFKNFLGGTGSDTGFIGSIAGALGFNIGGTSTADGLPLDTSANALRVVQVGNQLDQFKNAADGIKDAGKTADDIFAKARDGISGLFGDVGNVLSTLGAGLSSLFASASVSSASSSGGGFLSSLLGFGASLFGGGGIGITSGNMGLGDYGLGGGRAFGGNVSPGNLYPINEMGPEVLDVNGKAFLMMAGNKQGNVIPNDRVGRGGMTQTNNITITVPGNTDRRTADQIGTEVSRRISRANARGNA